jgi:asparaginyl-tRNA synthetase
VNRTRISEVLKSEALGSTFTVMGWVRTRRDSKGGFSFIELNDGSCIRGLQVIAESSLPNYEEEVKRLQTGAPSG